MSPSGSSGGFVVIGNPESVRVALFQAALDRLGEPPAVVVAWIDLLAGRTHLASVVRPGAVVRVESPGRDFEVERALLAAGAETPDKEEDWDSLSPHDVEALIFEKGRILCPRQWYRGFCHALERIERQLAEAPSHRRMSAPADVARMFDKPQCQADLANADLPTPRSLGIVRSYEELTDRMQQAGLCRVFVKLAHGSSASGVVAYETRSPRHQATTTVEMIRTGGAPALFNSRRIRVYREQREIALLIDALCRHRAHAEQWLPKAGMDGRAFDLRILVIAGQSRHSVMRSSRSPITNLHLLNARGDVEMVRQRMGPAAWQAAQETCERAMQLFPESLHAGIDLLIAPDFRRHAIAEINAFGDLLPGVLCEGLDTYTAEIATLQAIPSARRASAEERRSCCAPAS